MAEKFKEASLSIQEVAKALRMDPQTVRVLIQQNLVPWGKCVKLPNSSNFTYLISPLKFYEETGWKKD